MASSRGKQAYGAIMLALTLVIMATIVGLLILMVYLCTNIAYKFIPDKAKKNVKRMFTRKKDGAAAAEDESGGIKRGRSVVEAGLSFRDTAVDPEHRGRVPRRGLLDDAALRLDLRHDGSPRGLQAARGRRRRRSGGSRNGARGGQRRCRRAGCRARRGVIGPIGIPKTGEGLRRRRPGLDLVA